MRLGEFQKILDDQGIDACVFLDTDPNIPYFAGIELERCILIVPSESEPVFIVSRLEAERVLNNSRVKNAESFERSYERESLLAKHLKGSKVIGINKDCITTRDYEALQAIGRGFIFADVSDSVSSLRQIKTPEEAEKIRESCRLTDRIIEKCISSFDFKTELEVKNFLEFEAIKLGSRPSFDTIAASGKNASMPHYSGNGKIETGFCVIDFGIRHNGYCSDLSRTIYIGNPSKKERELYELVKKSQQAAIDSARDGITAEELDSIARNALGEHKNAFIHGLGHHIGIQVHDSGFRISPGSKGVLKEGMFITIEPGIYHAGVFGIRIEDDIAIMKKGCDILTRANKELVSVPTD